MNVLTSDFECTTWNKGSPYDLRNKAVCLGVKFDDGTSSCYFYEAMDEIAGGSPTSNYLYVFFNAKFDLSWYRKLGADISTWKIWCCQVAEFLLSGQKERYPSLEGSTAKYGLGQKLDVVKEQYWNKGINTDEIPKGVLSEYCIQDVDLTYKIYLLQLEQFQQQPALYKLFKLMMQDLLILQEMEWNGLKYDKDLCVTRDKENTTEIQEIQSRLNLIHPGIPINFNSGDQLSALLYGGIIYEDGKEHIGFYKTGTKIGLPKFKNVVKEHHLPRLVTPIKGSELKKEGVHTDGSVFKYYKTDEGTLRKLKGAAAQKYVGPLLRLAELEKLNSTYYGGLVTKASESNWEEGYLHGQYNQVVAQTGRLSSSNPNLQNFASDCLDILTSRYE